MQSAKHWDQTSISTRRERTVFFSKKEERELRDKLVWISGNVCTSLVRRLTKPESKTWDAKWFIFSSGYIPKNSWHNASMPISKATKTETLKERIDTSSPCASWKVRNNTCTSSARIKQIQEHLEWKWHMLSTPSPRLTQQSIRLLQCWQTYGITSKDDFINGIKNL
jgi:hypothetical protein